MTAQPKSISTGCPVADENVVGLQITVGDAGSGELAERVETPAHELLRLRGLELVGKARGVCQREAVDELEVAGRKARARSCGACPRKVGARKPVEQDSLTLRQIERRLLPHKSGAVRRFEEIDPAVVGAAFVDVEQAARDHAFDGIGERQFRKSRKVLRLDWFYAVLAE